MSRGYKQRCAERFERLQRRAAFLAERIAMRTDIDSVHDKQERSAVLWAIEQIGYLDVIAEASQHGHWHGFITNGEIR
jgi:hypothetical protein